MLSLGDESSLTLHVLHCRSQRCTSSSSPQRTQTQTSAASSGEHRAQGDFSVLPLLGHDIRRCPDVLWTLNGGLVQLRTILRTSILFSFSRTGYEVRRSPARHHCDHILSWNDTSATIRLLKRKMQKRLMLTLFYRFIVPRFRKRPASMASRM